MFQLPFANDHYGYRHGERDELGRQHPGVDFNGPGWGDSDEGKKYNGVGPGVVSYVGLGRNGGWGNHFFTRHDMRAYFTAHGVPMPDWCPATVWFHFAHNKEIFVKEGQRIDIDTVVASVGKSGTAEDKKKGRVWTAHLHWDLRNRPMGVTFYPPRTMTVQQFNAAFIDPEVFIKRINDWVSAKKASKAVPANDALAEAKERITRDERAIVALANLLAKHGHGPEATSIMMELPWIPKA